MLIFCIIGNPAGVHDWHKRWVILKDDTLLWSTEIKKIENVKDYNERSRFNGHITMNTIHSIKNYETFKKENKLKIKKIHKKRFIIIARNINPAFFEEREKNYMFQCINREERDYWVDGIKKYIKFYKEANQFYYQQ